MDELYKIVNKMDKCMHILNPILEKNTKNKILVFAFGAASYSRKTIVNVYNSLNKKYIKTHIILFCFDCGFDEEEILYNTIQDLQSINLENKYSDKDINLFSNINTDVILSNLKMPMNGELILSQQYFRKCAEKDNINDYFDYMLSDENNYNIQFQEFLMGIINFVSPEETIFMNDLFFNSWCYYYYDTFGNIKFMSQSPITLYNTEELVKISEKLKIKLPEKGDKVMRNMCDINIFFSQMVWVIKVMEDIYKTKNISIIEYMSHYNPMYNNNEYIFLKYKN